MNKIYSGSPVSKAQQGRPKDPHKGAIILEAAAGLFVRRGYGGTSMDAVAQTAGVSKQTLYSHFGGKEDLFIQVIKSKIRHYHFDNLSASLSGELVEDLHRLGQFFLGLILDQEAISMIRMVVGESAQHGKITQLFYQNGPGRVIRALEEWLLAQRQRGAIHFADSYEMAVIFLNLLKGEWYMQALMGIKLDIPGQEQQAHVARCVQQFLILLQHQPSAAGKPPAA